MGKAARFACILTPMLCTLVSLALLGLVMIGGTNKSNSYISNLYFFKIDTRYATAPQNLDLVPGTSLDDAFLKTGLPKTSTDLGLADFYTAHLWNHCSGEIVEDKDKKLVTKTTDCGKPAAMFYFDVIKIFVDATNKDGKKGIQESDLPSAVLKTNKAIKVVSNVMVALFCLGMVTTVVTFLVGWFGLLSRWGSCVTTILADVAFLFLLTASTIATGLYAAMREGFNKGVKDFGVKAELNNRMLILVWVAVAFSFAGALFWMMSTCCCSGRSSRIMGTDKKHNSGEKAPYAYERVAAPYMPTTQTTGVTGAHHAGYEPYRHAH